MVTKAFTHSHLQVFVLFAVLHFGSATAPATDRPDLTGVIKSKSGAVIEGASVFIYTAGPRVGPGDI